MVHLDGYHHHVMQRIAYKHISLGIPPEQYTIVGHHLLAAVAEVLGDAVTPEVADAWGEVYWLFATQLIAEEARLYQQADVDPTHPVRPYRVIRRIEETHGVVSLGAPDGQVSSFLHDHIVPGDLLDISAPAGDFFDQSSSAPILLASAGAGITTVLPIVEHIARTQPERPVIVAHADRTAQDHALRNTVLHVGRQIDDFTAYTWYETVEAGDRDSRPGRMDFPPCRCPRTCRCSPAGRCRSCARCDQRCWHGGAGGTNSVRGVRPRPMGSPDATGPCTRFLTEPPLPIRLPRSNP